MKVKVTIEHTADPTEETPSPKPTKWTMEAEADKEFPADRFASGVLTLLSVIRTGEVPGFSDKEEERIYGGPIFPNDPNSVFP